MIYIDKIQREKPMDPAVWHNYVETFKRNFNITNSTIAGSASSNITLSL